MDEEIQGVLRETHWGKAIPRARDRMQSMWLVVVGVPALVLAAVGSCVVAMTMGSVRSLLFPAVFSVVFAGVVLALRSATPAAAGVGLLVCLISAVAVKGPAGLLARPALSAL